MTHFEVIEDFPHIRMKISGRTPEELFSQALLGFASYVKPDILNVKKPDLKEWHKIKVEAVDLSSLLVEFLSAIIAHADEYSAVFSHVSFEKLGENFLEGKIFGSKVEAPEKEIRAVSYADVEIVKNHVTGLFETTLVFEI